MYDSVYKCLEQIKQYPDYSDEYTNNIRLRIIQIKYDKIMKKIHLDSTDKEWNEYGHYEELYVNELNEYLKWLKNRITAKQN